MAWEIIADWRRWEKMPAEQRLWSDISLGIVAKLMETEPRLRFIIRNLPLFKDAQGAMKNVFLPVPASEVPPLLRNHLEPPSGKPQIIRQYYCATCGTPEKPNWVPQMYIGLHKGHDLTRSEPTGRTVKPTWDPGYRLFMGSPARLRGLLGMMPSAALSSIPKDPLDLDGFDWVLTIAGKAGVSEEKRKSMADVLISAEEVVMLPAKTAELVPALLAWMVKANPKSLQPTKEEEEQKEVERNEAIRKKIQDAQDRVNRLREKGKTAPAGPPVSVNMTGSAKVEGPQ